MHMSPVLVATNTKHRGHPTHLPTSLITHTHTPVCPSPSSPILETPLFHEGLRDLLVRRLGTPCLYYTPSQCRAFTNVTRRQQNKPHRIRRRECFDSLDVLKQTWLQPAA
ncbi:hypothetical protein BDV11DRAFT_61235 [Aspergillus similis]